MKILWKFLGSPQTGHFLKLILVCVRVCVCVGGGGGHFVCILGSFLKVSVQNEILLGGGGKLVLKFLFYFRVCLEFLIFNF